MHFASEVPTEFGILDSQWKFVRTHKLLSDLNFEGKVASAAIDLIISQKIWHRYNGVCSLYCILIYSNELHCTGTVINFLLKKYTTFCLWISWTHLRLVRVRQRAHLLSFYALSRANMTSFTNRKYCRCRNAARKCTRHGHRQRARKLDEH